MLGGELLNNLGSTPVPALVTRVMNPSSVAMVSC